MLRVLVVLLLAQGIAFAHDTYPLTATEYKKRVAERNERHKQRLEDRMREHKLAEDRRQMARKRLAAIEAEMSKAVEEAVKDQTVTQAEADRIKQRNKQLREALYKELGFEVKRGE
jgi:regulator of protease activity HflC (stomatin/prohibitin superfamily)